VKLSSYPLAAILGISALAQTASTISVTGAKGQEAVSISNIVYEVAGDLVLRKTERTKQVMGEKGMEAQTRLEVWPLGSGRAVKPRYSIEVEGVQGQALDNSLFIVSRGLEDVEWWSLYRLSDGKPHFDTHVRPVRLSYFGRFAGFDIPADGDPRLKDQRLIGVVHIDTGKGLRHVDLVCDDTKRAQLLRSYWDVRHSMAFDEGAGKLTLRIKDAVPDIQIEIGLDGTVRAPAGIHAR